VTDCHSASREPTNRRTVVTPTRTALAIATLLGRGLARAGPFSNRHNLPPHALQSHLVLNYLKAKYVRCSKIFPFVIAERRVEMLQK
jgi:hypothetical protein